MLNDKLKIYYSVALDKPYVTDCTSSPDRCIDSQSVAKYFIKEFFKFWWTTPSGSSQRRKVSFVTEGIVQGPLTGKAWAIIKNEEREGGCKHEAPLVRPSFAGSQIFPYHSDAAAAWREYVVDKYLAGLIEDLGLTKPKVLDTWNRIVDLQTNATLAYLPANNVGQWLVNVPVKPSKPYEHEEYHKHLA